MTSYYGLLIQIYYPEIALHVQPLHRFMSAFEQKIETPERQYQYLLVAAEPYETIGIKMPSKEVDLSSDRYIKHWDAVTKTLTLQFFLKSDKGPRPYLAP